MEWLKNILKEQYTLVRVFKQNQHKTILLLRHKEQKKDILYRSYEGSGDVYRLLRTISHPNLPTVYEVLEDQGRVIVLEEYIDGMSVSAVLENGLYSEYGVQQVVSSVCDALEALHTFGIIHRDIKPENIMIDNDGHVTLIDFDAAKLYKPFHSEDTMLVGTAGYAAPEQFGIAQSDKRSDIFALGVLMNVMLTGDHPSKRMYHGKMAKIIQRCVQVDPNKRYPSAADLKAAINFIRPKQRA